MLVTIITKMVNPNKSNWDDYLILALWASMTTYKVTAQYTPLELVVDTQQLLQSNLLVPTFTNITPKDKKPKCILVARHNDMHQLDNGGKKRNPINKHGNKTS